MNYKVYILLFSLVVAPLFALADQPSEPIVRTAEEIAKKQTHRLVRELDIKDSLQIDTLYKMHLKYARMRVKSNTRREDLERLMSMTEELKGILTEEQYNTFMNKQVNHSPRAGLSPVGPMPQPQGDKRPRRRQAK